tara:strand:+ start:831 stop:977 length:147 start_codon:yes stop_codon:yes gene_type:complete
MDKYKIERKIIDNPELTRTIRNIERKSKKLRKVKIQKKLEKEVKDLEK